MLVVDMVMVSQLGGTVGCLPPLEATMAPPGTMKVRPQGRDIKVSFISGLLSPVSDKRSVLNSRDSPCTIRGLTKGKSNRLCVMEIS